MRWKKDLNEPNTVKSPEHGDTRTIKLFLLFPRTIKNETRWLEKAKIRQVYDGNRWIEGERMKLVVGENKWIDTNWT